MYTLEGLLNNANQNQVEINGNWVPARPVEIMDCLEFRRLRDAWAVLTGKADAFVWPEGQ